jgi:hypothetical protein
VTWSTAPVVATRLRFATRTEEPRRIIPFAPITDRSCCNCYFNAIRIDGINQSNAAPGERRQSERRSAVKLADKQAANEAAHLARDRKSQEVEAVDVGDDDGITGTVSDQVVMKLSRDQGGG